MEYTVRKGEGFRLGISSPIRDYIWELGTFDGCCWCHYLKRQVIILAWGFIQYLLKPCNVQISECPSKGLCCYHCRRCRFDTLQVVQARVWAQGLTVGVLLVAGALTHSKRQEAVAQRKVCHQC